MASRGLRTTEIVAQRCALAGIAAAEGAFSVHSLHAALQNTPLDESDGHVRPPRREDPMAYIARPA